MRRHVIGIRCIFYAVRACDLIAQGRAVFLVCMILPLNSDWRSECFLKLMFLIARWNSVRHWLKINRITHWPFTFVPNKYRRKVRNDELNCFFCEMVDWRKAFSLISSRDHCQRSSPSRIPDTSRAGSEHTQNLSSGFVEWSCAVVIPGIDSKCCTIDRRQINGLVSIW